MWIEFLQKDHPKWQEYADEIATVDWGAAKYLAKKMHQAEFSDWEGIFVARSKDQLAGFCTIVKKDIVPIDVSPFIAIVYVSPSFRGQHLSQKLVTAAEERLHQIGFATVYIVTQLEGLYEKLGFEQIGEAQDQFGRQMRVLRKDSKS
jgi:ribosomal protein S18 acetylase RimI-like enzyme